MIIGAVYDDIADVLYVSAKSVVDTDSIEEIEGLVFSYDSANHEPVAATIMDYQHYWVPQGEFLATRLAYFFGISPSITRLALSSVG